MLNISVSALEFDANTLEALIQESNCVQKPMQEFWKLGISLFAEERYCLERERERERAGGRGWKGGSERGRETSKTEGKEYSIEVHRKTFMVTLVFAQVW